MVKWIALLLQIRWHNILAMAVAQYITAIFLFNKPAAWKEILSDAKLHLIVFSVAFLVAGGYLINNFYDREKDRINRPLRTAIEANIKKSTVLYGYFFFTLLGSLLAFMVSYRALLFFGGYAFLLWAYSHKFKKITLFGNLIATLLVVIPFFGLLLYYDVSNLLIFYYGFFFSWLLFLKETVKDFRYYKGDLVMNYPTVPVALGIIRAGKLLKTYAGIGIIICLGLWLLPFSKTPKILAATVSIAYFYIFIFLRFDENTTTKSKWLLSFLKLLLITGIAILPFLF
ncbi:MAG: UbiA family prenyltransferase [Cryomorphaceae bacterium]|nr:UbiA family prenyltransferase [Cryomorphaceae bacterium]